MALAWSIKLGETRIWTLTLTTDGTTPISGTLSNPRSEWRAGKTSSDPIVAVFGTDTVCPVVGAISASANVITLTLDNTQSKLLTPGLKTYFDVFVDIDGEPFCVSGDSTPGQVTVYSSITVPE